MTTSSLSCHLNVQHQSFLLCEAVGEESLTQPMRWRGSLVLPSTQTPEQWINQPATLVIQSHRPLRRMSGTIESITITPHSTDRLNRVDFILQATLSLLQSHYSARMETQCRAAKIIHQLLSTHQLPYRWHMKEPLPQPPFWRQQPDETDWQFLRHILRQIGGYCWCDYTDTGQEYIVFANHPAAHASYSTTLSSSFTPSQRVTHFVITQQDSPKGLRLFNDDPGSWRPAQQASSSEHQWHGFGAYSTSHAHQLANWRQQAHAGASTITVHACLPDLALATQLTTAPSTTWLVTGIKHFFTAGYLPYSQQLTLHPANVPWRLAPMADSRQPNWSLGRIQHTRRTTRPLYSVAFHQHPRTASPSPTLIKCAIGASPPAPLPVGIHWPLTHDTTVVMQWLHGQRHQPVIFATLATKAHPSVVTARNHTQHRWQWDARTGFILEDATSTAGIELFTATSRLSFTHHARQQHLAIHTQNHLHLAAQNHITWRSQQDLHGVINKNAQWHSEQLLRIVSKRNAFSHSGAEHRLQSPDIRITAQQSLLRSKKDQRLFADRLQCHSHQSFLGCSRAANIQLRAADHLQIRGTGMGTLILRAGSQTYITLLADGSIHLHAPVIQCSSTVHFNGEVQTVSAPSPIPRPYRVSTPPPLNPFWRPFPRAPTWQTPEFLT